MVTINRDPQHKERDFSKSPRLNDEITSDQVRVIGADGKQIGVISLSEAKSHAEIEGLDLVEIVPNAKPPVCKIIDFGKYRYEQTKKDKAARKKQHIILVKKIRFRPNIDNHDFNTKLGKARQFIGEGNRVKATVMMRGRQITRKDLAEQVLIRLSMELEDIAKSDGKPKFEGANNLSVLLVPKK